MKRLIFAVMTLAVLLFCTGCGTLFFSHRVGKKLSNKIDYRVFGTNCFLCLFGGIPGIVAFILDYDNGSIYYTEAELIPEDDLFGMDPSVNMKRVPCRSMSFEDIARTLSAEIGKKITPEEIEAALNRSGSPDLL